MSTSTQCHSCQGRGHMRRDCPTVYAGQKGYHKDKGNGMGATKWSRQGGKAEGKGQKGGKGDTSACYKCIWPGYKAANCRSWSEIGVDHELGEGLREGIPRSLAEPQATPMASGFWVGRRVLQAFPVDAVLRRCSAIA